jgi:hypothetical protein
MAGELTRETGGKVIFHLSGLADRLVSLFKKGTELDKVVIEAYVNASDTLRASVSVTAVSSSPELEYVHVQWSLGDDGDKHVISISSEGSKSVPAADVDLANLKVTPEIQAQFDLLWELQQKDKAA